MRVLTALSSALLLLPSVVDGAARFVDVQVTLRGKKYEVNNVEKVSDIQKNVEELAGLEVAKQGVLFGGKKLKSTDVLEDLGIENGSVINIVPSTSTSGKKKATTVSDSSDPLSAASGLMEGMEEMMQQAGIDKDEIEAMLGPNGQPDMLKSMEMMQKMMSSPFFKDFIEDPERLEQSRQMILQNPMMKAMMASLPGFDEIINDKEKWRETMLAAVSMYQNMGSDMMQAMADMSGMGGMGGMPGMGAFGMPDGPGAGAFAGLDELSEGEM